MDLEKINLEDLDIIASWVATPIENHLDFENWVGNYLFGASVEENKQWEYAVLIWRLSKDPSFVKDIISWAKLEPELLWVLVNGLKVDGAVEVENKYVFVKPSGYAKTGKVAIEVDGQKVTGGDLAIFETGKLFKFHQGLSINKKNKWEFLGSGKIIVDARQEVDRKELLKWQKQIGL